MSTVTGKPPVKRKGRVCLLCGSAYGLRLTVTLASGIEIWQCEKTGACAERRVRQDFVLADWPCHHAEGTARLQLRVATDMSWRDWHLARWKQSGDEQELVRAGRHPSQFAGGPK